MQNLCLLVSFWDEQAEVLHSWKIKTSVTIGASSKSEPWCFDLSLQLDAQNSSLV